MKVTVQYRQEKDWFVGHIPEFPDFESQGETLEELEENLIEIYRDIEMGLVPETNSFNRLHGYQRETQ